jgi:thiamine monophosphate kinase
MRPDIHLHPDRLRAHAAAAIDLSDGLLGSLMRVGRPSVNGAAPALDPDHVAELDRLDHAVRRAVEELAGLAAALDNAATTTTAADDSAAHAFRRVAEGS